jgi:predicted RNA-binding Zn-ribbon protein involved in translation (DUF1610 family)
MINLNASRGLSLVAGLLCIGGILSYMKADVRAKPFALSIAVGAGSLAIGSQLLSKWYEDLANDQLKEITAKLEKDRDSIKHDCQRQTTALAEVKALSDKQSAQLMKLAEELEAKNTALKLLQDNLGRIQSEFEAKGRELDAKLEQDDTRFEDLLHEFKGQLAEDLGERIYKIYNELSTSVEARLQCDDYQAIHENLQQFFDSLEPKYNFHCSLLNEITSLDGTVSEILTNAIDIYHQVSDEITALKVRFRNLLNIDERRALDDAYTTLADYNKKFTPIDKAKSVLNEYRDFQKEQLEKLYGSISENQNSLEEMRSQVGDLLNQLDEQHLKVAQLNQQILELKKPLKWSLAQSRELQIGNLIIEYFWQSGIYLDRTHSQGDVYSVKLYFQIDRNSRAIAAKELNEHSEALQTYCRVLKPVVFSWDADVALMCADVALKEREKIPTSIEEIRRLIEPASRFGDIVRKYHDHTQDGCPTLRVMTRTGGGKGVAVKNILHNYVNNLEGYEIWLSDPQHGSQQDYWDVLKAAKSPNEAKTLLDTFIDEFHARKNGKSKHPNVPVLGVFDETDKTFDKNEKKAIAEIWTEIRHRDMRLILIGQSGEVGKNGWTWDEMNNCALLFIGEAIGTAIKHADDMGWDSGMKDKIPSTYRTVSEWMVEANKNIPAKNRYRLGLLVRGLRYDFVEIPVAIEGSFDNNLSALVNKPWESQNLGWVEIQSPAELMPAVCCPHCGSTSWKKNGKDKATKTIQQYKCNDCGKGFSELDIIPNSN